MFVLELLKNVVDQFVSLSIFRHFYVAQAFDGVWHAGLLHKIRFLPTPLGIFNSQIIFT